MTKSFPSLKKQGYWRGRQYKRRAVEREIREIGGFIGWESLLQLVERLRGAKVQRNRALFASAFLTGGRIGEVLLLKSSNFMIKPYEVVVQQMPLSKRYEKTGEWKEWQDLKPDNKLGRLFKKDEEKDMYYRIRFYTERKPEVRGNFSFPVEEPLANLLIDWVQESEDWLFPGYKDGPLSYIRSYQVLTQAGIHPHWLRAQRASCLVSFYGLKMEEMMEWMGWEELSTARMYARFGIKTLGRKMMSQNYPVEALKIATRL